jgi:hypothetical protein
MRKTERVRLITSVPYGDLARQLADELDRAAIAKLIYDLDALVADYDFTKKLRNYFVAEIKEEDRALGKEVDDGEG